MVLKSLPEYLWNFGRCFSSPQKFVENLFKENENDVLEAGSRRAIFQKALTFMGLSVLFSVCFQTLSFEDPEFWKQVVGSCITTFLGVVLVALALRFSWICVGGKTDFTKYFVIDAYVTGVGILLISAVNGLQFGVNRIFEIGDGELMSSIIIYIGVLGVGCWALIFWETYRLLNNLGKIRAFFALVIFNVINLPIYFSILIMGRSFQQIAIASIEICNVSNDTQDLGKVAAEAAIRWSEP